MLEDAALLAGAKCARQVLEDAALLAGALRARQVRSSSFQWMYLLMLQLYLITQTLQWQSVAPVDVLAIFAASPNHVDDSMTVRSSSLQWMSLLILQRFLII